MCESPSTVDRMKQWVIDKLQKTISIEDAAMPLGGNRRGSIPTFVPNIVISGTNSPNPRTTRSARPSSLRKLRTSNDWETNEMYHSDRHIVSPTGISIRKEHILFSFEQLSSEENENRMCVADTGNTSAAALERQESGSSFKRACLNHSPQSPLGFQRSQKSQSFPEEPKHFTGLSGGINCSQGTPTPILHTKQHAYSNDAKTVPSQSPNDRIRALRNKARKHSIHGDNSTSDQQPTRLFNRAWSTCSTRRKATIKQQMRHYSSQADLLKKADVSEPSGFKSNSATEYESFSSSKVSIKGSESDIVSVKKRMKNLSFRSSDRHPEMTKHKSFQSDGDEGRRMSLNETELRFNRERRRSSFFKLSCVDKQDNIEETDAQSECAGSTEPVYYDYKDVDGVKKRSAESRTDYLEKVYNGIPIGGLPTMFDLNKAPSEWGSIQMRFQYFSKTRRFQVSLLRGANIGQGVEMLSMFVKVCLLPGKIQKKRGYGSHETVDPVFYETFHFSRLTLDALCEKLVRVKFYNRQRLCSSSMPLGEAIVPLFNYDLTAETVIWKNLRRCSGQKGEKGDMDSFDFGLLDRASTLANDLI